MKPTECWIWALLATLIKIIERLPEQRQNLLFSATISNEVRALAKTLYLQTR